jgi:hypothetical protein
VRKVDRDQGSAAPRSNLADERNETPVPSRDVFGHDRPKSSEGGIVSYLDRFAIFPCPVETGESLPASVAKRGDCRVDPERGDSSAAQLA